jgi:hypothetical protein
MQTEAMIFPQYFEVAENFMLVLCGIVVKNIENNPC